MREIPCDEITQTIARLCVEANYNLGDDVVRALVRARDAEVSPGGRDVLDQLLQNANIAREERMPLCQDTGLTVVFVELGQDLHVVGGDLYQAIDKGVRQGYEEGYLRKSVVDKPFSERTNTGDNTPAVIHCEVVAGDKLTLRVVPKGGGSENMSSLAMLTPADGREGIADFVVQTVERAGANPCPPTVIGVGVGGTAEKAMWLAKHSLLRELGEPSSDPDVAELEQDILKRVNKLGIGPGGLGGSVTSLAVHVETHPCHIASLPVAVNIQCHSARHKEAIL